MSKHYRGSKKKTLNPSLPGADPPEETNVLEYQVQDLHATSEAFLRQVDANVEVPCSRIAAAKGHQAGVSGGIRVCASGHDSGQTNSPMCPEGPSPSVEAIGQVLPLEQGE